MTSPSTNSLTITCYNCSVDEKTTVILHGNPKEGTTSICHCPMCRIRSSGVGGCFVTYDREHVEIVRLNDERYSGTAKNQDGEHTVFCKCLSPIFYHTKDYKTDPELKVNMGAICHALYGESPTIKTSGMDALNFDAEFFMPNEMQHLNYEQRVLDWKHNTSAPNDDAPSKKPLPSSVLDAIKSKTYPAACWCGNAQAVCRGDKIGTTICHCSRCRQRTSTMDCSVEFPTDSVEYLTPDMIVTRNFETMVYNECKDCGTVLVTKMKGSPVAVVNLSSLLKGMGVVGDRPAAYDWGHRSNTRLHGPTELVDVVHHKFYANRHINQHDDSSKWVGVPGPFGGDGGLMDVHGNRIEEEKDDK
mmetsp:Transcript_18918/g.31306  ORF Transcript_18918/g.31306 Transcript_18918/m.31306 type:complete len:359 (+) Transcript_18918:95-1171(+)|eukprot:CAMPEP_0119008336 /NCGR_PEP_ID=MMETSP1176-20130426/3619_1 /TAXON_ID=265551 /ORGANISM="Synedropsis recta cf, Strain CCMP1620" /LENGTH=358 /DNA_ID=CAMNT_0006960649 /DNA_START=103 /DNA_END=1179 /DNA_ORIENTATION=+